MNKDLKYRLFNSVVILLVTVFVIYACDSEATEMKTENTAVKITKTDTTAAALTEERKPSFHVKYKIDSFQTRAAIDRFKTKFSPEEQNIIFALNRMDSWRLKEGKILVVPDTLTGDLMDYSPFPKKLEILDSIPKAVLISRRIQAIALYEKGKMISWGPASTGKESTQTPAGLYYGNYKAKRKVSTINKDWIMPYYFNYMNQEGVGTHKYSLPGYPASHGCVRLREQEAISIYNWAGQWKLNSNEQVVLKNGTPFMVFGNFDFESSPPWFRMTEEPEINLLSPDELETLKSYVEKYSKDERNFATEEKEISLPVPTQIETLH